MTNMRGKLISIAEVWHDDEIESNLKADVIYYLQQENPVEGLQCREFYTIEIDLTKSEDELWEDIAKNDKYKIKRAKEKDELFYQFWDVIDVDILSDFYEFYSRFASQRELSIMKISRLMSFVEAGSLALSKISSKDGETLIWHSYFCQKDRVHLLQSASIRHETDTNFNSMLGRGNRYHHWQDILNFKNLGFAIYDFGGWYAGNTDQQKLGINQFKEKFGGKIVKTFNCSYGKTLKGRAYLHLRKIFQGRLEAEDQK